MTCYEYAKQSIRGKRKNQEDTCEFYFGRAQNLPEQIADDRQDKILAVLADGMGGHVGGAFASRLVCSNFISHYSSQSDDQEPQRLTSSLHVGNKIITDKITEDTSLNGMGCTLIGAVFEKNRLYWVSVGDSLLYLFRDNQLSQLNEEHSYYYDLLKLAKAGEITTEQAETHPHRNALTSAVMGKKIEHIDVRITAFILQPGDWILLASDGILTLSKDEISSIIADNKSLGAKRVVKALLSGIEEVGKSNQDNATIMAIRPIMDQVQATATTEKTSFFSSLIRPFKMLILILATIYLWIAPSKNSTALASYEALCPAIILQASDLLIRNPPLTRPNNEGETR